MQPVFYWGPIPPPGDQVEASNGNEIDDTDDADPEDDIDDPIVFVIGPDEADIEAEPVPLNFDIDFRARQLGLGYLEEDNIFVLHAFDIAAAIDEPLPTFRCLISRGRARVLARTIERVVAGGRPICPLCESPMEPGGHVCPRSNGHHAPASV